jgi:16S rRNA (uracil1498-N3)-methyltransferase
VRPPVFLAEGAALAADTVVLSGAEGRHATTVRRLAPGERLDLTDGAGTTAQCVITAARPGVVELSVLGRSTEPAPVPRVIVVQAIPKGDRGEQAVETMTEVGVDVVVPWAAERCVAIWRGDRADKGAARWRSTALQAAKQSRRAWFPEVTAVAPTAAVADRIRAAGLALLLDPDAPRAVTDLAAASIAALDIAAAGPSAGGPSAGGPSAGGPSAGRAAGDIVLVVGPEGGIAPGETEVLAAAGAVGARLGPTVLRASSAGAVAAALVMSATGRWA